MRNPTPPGWLIGMASIAVIGFVLYFFVGEHRASSEAEHAAQMARCEAARTHAEDVLSGKKTETPGEHAQNARALQRCTDYLRN